ncbi:helix-turn-helix domain-containing protein [Nocardia sp. NBC_00416]|uniref:helix-turn-helix domain-containing protein n=1 Tax=Nocardia sp. NBC_00416 TaxID=2975991 RepID=UPI003FA5A90F
MRCRIVLACAEPGAANAHVAAAVGVTPITVAKWRKRFTVRSATPKVSAVNRIWSLVPADILVSPHSAGTWMVIGVRQSARISVWRTCSPRSWRAHRPWRCTGSSGSWEL